MFETGRRAHQSQALRVRHLDWNTYVPDEREGVDTGKVDADDIPWFQAQNALCYQHPSVVLVERIVFRQDVEVKSEVKSKKTKHGLKEDEKNGEKSQGRLNTNKKNTSAFHESSKSDGKGASPNSKQDAKTDEIKSNLCENVKKKTTDDSTAKRDGKKATVRKSGKATQQDLGLDGNDTLTTNQNHTEEEDGALYINQGLRMDGKGTLPQTAKSSSVLRRMELDANGFFEFLFSNRWEEGCLLRVMEGKLLDSLLHVLNQLEKYHDVISYVTMAFMYNRRPLVPCIKTATGTVKPELVVEKVLVELDCFCAQERPEIVTQQLQTELSSSVSGDHSASVCADAQQQDEQSNTSVLPRRNSVPSETETSDEGLDLTAAATNYSKNCVSESEIKSSWPAASEKSESNSILRTGRNKSVLSEAETSGEAQTAVNNSLTVKGVSQRKLPSHKLAELYDSGPQISFNASGDWPFSFGGSTSWSESALTGTTSGCVKLPDIHCNIRGMTKPPPHTSCLKPYHMTREPFLQRRHRKQSAFPTIHLPELPSAGLVAVGPQLSGRFEDPAEDETYLGPKLADETESVASICFLQHISTLFISNESLANARSVKSLRSVKSVFSKDLIQERLKAKKLAKKMKRSSQQSLRITGEETFSDEEEQEITSRINPAREAEFQKDVELMATDLMANPASPRTKKKGIKGRLKKELRTKRLGKQVSLTTEHVQHQLPTTIQQKCFGDSLTESSLSYSGAIPDPSCKYLKKWDKCPAFDEFYHYLVEEERRALFGSIGTTRSPSLASAGSGTRSQLTSKERLLVEDFMQERKLSRTASKPKVRESSRRKSPFKDQDFEYNLDDSAEEYRRASRAKTDKDKDQLAEKYRRASHVKTDIHRDQLAEKHRRMSQLKPADHDADKKRRKSSTSQRRVSYKEHEADKKKHKPGKEQRGVSQEEDKEGQPKRKKRDSQISENAFSSADSSGNVEDQDKRKRKLSPTKSPPTLSKMHAHTRIGLARGFPKIPQIIKEEDKSLEAQLFSVELSKSGSKQNLTEMIHNANRGITPSGTHLLTADQEELLQQESLIISDMDPWHISVKFAYLAGGVCDSIGVRNDLLRRRNRIYHLIAESKLILKINESRLWAMVRSISSSSMEWPEMRQIWAKIPESLPTEGETTSKGKSVLIKVKKEKAGKIRKEKPESHLTHDLEESEDDFLPGERRKKGKKQKPESEIDSSDDNLSEEDVEDKDEDKDEDERHAKKKRRAGKKDKATKEDKDAGSKDKAEGKKGKPEEKAPAETKGSKISERQESKDPHEKKGKKKTVKDVNVTDSDEEFDVQKFLELRNQQGKTRRSAKKVCSGTCLYISDSEVPDDIKPEALFKLMELNKRFDPKQLKSSYSFEKLYAHRSKTFPDYAKLLSIFEKPFKGKKKAKEKGKKKSKVKKQPDLGTAEVEEPPAQPSPHPFVLGKLKDFKFLQHKHHIPGLVNQTQHPRNEMSVEELREHLLLAMQMFAVRKERATTLTGCYGIRSKVTVTFTRRAPGDTFLGVPPIIDCSRMVAAVCNTLRGN